MWHDIFQFYADAISVATICSGRRSIGRAPCGHTATIHGASDDLDGALPFDPSRHGVCRHTIRTEPANTGNGRHRWLALSGPAPLPEPTAHDSRSKRSSQPHTTSAVALLALPAVSSISGQVMHQRHSPPLASDGS